jgi:hypothetical protein
MYAILDMKVKTGPRERGLLFCGGVGVSRGRESCRLLPPFEAGYYYGITDETDREWYDMNGVVYNRGSARSRRPATLADMDEEQYQDWRQKK